MLLKQGQTVWELSEPTGSFVKILQRPKKDFTEFVDWISSALHHQINSPTVEDILLKQLAYENANKDCKAALNTICQNGSLGDFVQRCQNVGTQAHKQAKLAQAICAAFKNNFSSSHVKCFQCGKSRHMKKACCSGPKTDVTIPPSTGENKTSGLYPRYQKGNHWANQCRSKFHRNGSALQPGNCHQGQP